ncbi:putative non-specific serine/threonine protein kinase [Rosa chinensis]|uniref:Putative non-specific serine/threonine protein kinase n=1 Tax=Rosa chinensis TaxID=74649 RepID=A0A2P6PAT1_ROSCH|nr:putative non-specific serine/threonine protein kinase [Rosa chinensis]
MSPRIFKWGEASKESDVLSFGVVALELSCGKRTHQDGEYHVPLFLWIWSLKLEGRLLDVADERLEMTFGQREMEYYVC